MTSLIAFPGVSLPEATPELPPEPLEFLEVVDQDETRARVASSIAELMRFSDYDFSTPYTIGLHPGATEYGTVRMIPLDSIGITGGKGIITSLQFPRALEKLDLPQHAAVNLAADFVHAYGLYTKGVTVLHKRSEPITHTFASSQETGLWAEPFANQAPGQAVPYRFAAQVALHAQGLNRIIIGESPLPPHMAALQNPLDEMEISMLHRVAQKAA